MNMMTLLYGLTYSRSVKHIYLKGRQAEMKIGKHPFWLDNKPLFMLAPVHFELCCEKNITASCRVKSLLGVDSLLFCISNGLL
jgi:hypothetical protein